MRTRSLLKSICLISLFTTTFTATTVQAEDITGAGASFPAPVYAKWADSYYKETGNRVNYQSIGSSAGVKQILAKTVDFGASDAPLTEQALTKDGLIQFPTIIGGVVPVINIKGIPSDVVKLTGEVLADIYLGNITNWQDEAIKQLNPTLNLPDAKITVVRRADGSGTSFVFTSYLTKVSEVWKNSVGVGSAVKWPVGVGGKGNEGVSAYVMRLPNSIGYVEYAYAKQNNLAHVQLKNAAGQFVSPSDQTFQAAAAGIDWQKTFAQDMTNAAGANAWPLSTATYILLYQKTDSPLKTQATLAFFNWALAQGDKAAIDLDYVPFPDTVKQIIRQSWQIITNDQGQMIHYQ
ncbi:phosphate ABC transporter substrate-binding protein PstS [Utexia brackfieldae]|uniref:phosphate ABC transporter substrate-binding protein PstS n=1 Tax=Utexia brackfieldae TaxID=3074108 RepID=UPI00370D164A